MIRFLGLSTLIGLLSGGCLMTGCSAPAAQPTTFAEGQQSKDWWLNAVKEGNGDAHIAHDGKISFFFGTQFGIDHGTQGMGNLNYARDAANNTALSLATLDAINRLATNIEATKATEKPK